MWASLKLMFFYSVSIPLGALLGLPWTWITGDASLLYRMGTWVAYTGVRVAGVRVHITGLENVPAGVACIFMANHVSNLDPPILLPLLPGRTSALVKSQLMRVPILGAALRLAGVISVERDRKRESAIANIQQATRVMAAGIHITVFPEGTRSRDGRMLPFKKGPFYLAEQAGAPILPISIHGTESMMRKGSVRVFPADAYVQFHPPLVPANYASREDLMEATRQSIASGLPEWMRGTAPGDQP
jgi:1-acyl-sn-glycerol-3-phosphate acyltransferase